MLKILQVRLQQYMNHELRYLQANLEKAEESEIKLPTSFISLKKPESSRKHLLLLYWLHQSFWLCGSQQTGKFLKRWEYHTTWLAFWEICLQARKQQLKLDMEQQTGSKSGKKYIKAIYCHPAYLTDMISNHLILCHPLFLLSLIFPCIRTF